MKQLVLVGFVFLAVSSVMADDKRDAGNSPEAKAGKQDQPEAKGAGPRDGEGGIKPEGARDGAAKKAEAAAKPDQVAKLRSKEGKIFVAYDRDKSGGVTGEEIASMSEGKKSRREIRKLKELVEDLDKDGNKKELNLDEFTDYLKHRRSGKRD